MKCRLLLQTAVYFYEEERERDKSPQIYALEEKRKFRR